MGEGGKDKILRKDTGEDMGEGREDMGEGWKILGKERKIWEEGKKWEEIYGGRRGRYWLWTKCFTRCSHSACIFSKYSDVFQDVHRSFQGVPGVI